MGSIVLGKIIGSALIGAGINAAAYTTSVAFSSGGFSNWSWGQFGNAVGMGALSGAATAGIGQAFGSVGSIGKELGRASAHALSSGGISRLGGGDFMTGFVNGAVGGVVPSIGGTGVIPGAGLGALSGGVVGGITAELTGGNFADGFKQGALSGAISGGIHGGIAASQSKFDRSLLFGNLTRSGRKQAFLHYAKQYNLQANGAKNIKFADLANAYGTTAPLDPNTGKPTNLAKVGRLYPQGVDSEVTFGLGRLMSLKKIRAMFYMRGSTLLIFERVKQLSFLMLLKLT